MPEPIWADINWEAATTAVQERLFDISIDVDRIDSLDRHAAGRLARAAIRAAIPAAYRHAAALNTQERPEA